MCGKDVQGTPKETIRGVQILGTNPLEPTRFLGAGVKVGLPPHVAEEAYPRPGRQGRMGSTLRRPSCLGEYGCKSLPGRIHPGPRYLEQAVQA